MPEALRARARQVWRAALPAGWGPTPGVDDALRPAAWAQRVEPGWPGVENLWRVAPGLLRSGQPTAEGFRHLAAMGICRVISLRQTVSDAPLAAGTGLDLVRVPMKSRHVAEDHGARVVKAMRALAEGLERGPVLVHCHHGSDRTGLIIALWRMLYDGWPRQAALEELMLGGYGYHAVWANIPRYLRVVDLKDLRARIEA